MEKNITLCFVASYLPPPQPQSGKLTYEAPKVIKLITNEELMLTNIGINTSKTTKVGNALSRRMQSESQEEESSNNSGIFSDFEAKWPE